MAPSGRNSEDSSIGDKMSEEVQLHERKKKMSATLSSDLREDIGLRSLPVREGDKVKILRGDFKGIEGEVSELNTDSKQIVVEGVETARADETEVPTPVHPSNVEITDVEMDNVREKIIDRRSEYGKERRKKALEETKRSESAESQKEE